MMQSLLNLYEGFCHIVANIVIRHIVEIIAIVSQSDIPTGIVIT